MKDGLQSFKERLAALRHYIDGLEIESELLSATIESDTPSPESIVVKFQEHLVPFISQVRIFNYNSIVISLYGFFEQFIESMLRNYIDYLNEIVPKFSELPDSIKQNHTELSFEQIKRIKSSRYRGDFTETEIILSLHTCVNDADNYQVNAEAFVHHTANFRTDVIQESFTQVGVENISRRVLECTGFQDYLKTVNPDRDVENIKIDEAFFYLDDLAERRNEVAHGAPSEMLNNTRFLDYITFFEAYGLALYEVVYESTLPYIVKHHGIELGPPIAVYNSKIVGISVSNRTVQVGDLLIAQTANTARPYLASEIQSLHVDKTAYKEVPANPDGVDIGMRVTFNAKDNQSFFLVPKRALHSVNNVSST
jgi:hypothetical protein